jgi:NAD/NADP transhydrogenase beta subunit
MIGMAIAVLATVFGPARHARHPWIIGAMLSWAARIGLYAARSCR